MYTCMGGGCGQLEYMYTPFFDSQGLRYIHTEGKRESGKQTRCPLKPLYCLHSQLTHTDNGCPISLDNTQGDVCLGSTIPGLVDKQLELLGS